MLLGIGVALWVILLIAGCFLVFLTTTSSLDKFRERVSLAHAKLVCSTAYCILHSCLGIAVCGLFCIRTYTKSAGTLDVVVEIAACIVYLMDLLPDMCAKCLADAWTGLGFLFSAVIPDVVIGASTITLAMVEVSGSKTWSNWAFFASLHLLTSWKRVLRISNVNLQMLEWQIIDLAAQAVTLLFFAAMMVMTLENLGEPDMLKAYGGQKWTTLSSFYYVAITISTVGYGDLVPRTGIGRLVAVVAVFGGIACVVLAMSKLVQVISLQKQGLGAWQPLLKSKHIIVTGNPTTQMLKEFMAELFHPDHDDEAEDLHLVCLFPKGCNTLSEIIKFLALRRNINLAPRVHPLGGSVLDRGDLIRASAAYASCFFVLPNTRSAEPRKEDTESIIRAMGIQKAAPHARIIVMLLKSEHRQMALDAGMTSSDGQGASDREKGASLTILAIDELKMEMVGKSCAIPGFVTFMSNLCTSVAVSDEDREAGRHVKLPWQQEYEAGLGMEIYEVELSTLYMARQAVFIEVVVDVLEQTSGSVYLIGLVEQSMDGKRVLINPGPNYKIKQVTELVETSGIFIASNREAVVQCEGGMVFLGRRERTKADNKKKKAPAAETWEHWEHNPEEVEEQAALAKERLQPEMARRAQKIVKLVHKYRKSASAARPPMKTLGRGGHVLVLCLGSGEGRQAGLDHFVRPLRRHLDFLGNEVKPVVAMAAELPVDWSAVADIDQVFFLQGSPMEQFDLERCNFRAAAYIFICHMGGTSLAGAEKDMWTVDSEVICCGRWVESQLDPRGSHRPSVILDLFCDSNHAFISQVTTEVKDLRMRGVRHRKSSVYGAIKTMTKRLSVGKQAAAKEQAAENADFQGVPYYRTARYASGQLFVGTTVTSLMVNTFYNPSLCELVSAMIASPMSRVEVPAAWVGKSFVELFDHLLWVEHLLAIGVFRERSNGKGGLAYLYTAPPGKETTMAAGDFVVCFGCSEIADEVVGGARRRSGPADRQGRAAPKLDQRRSLSTLGSMNSADSTQGARMEGGDPSPKGGASRT